MLSERRTRTLARLRMVRWRWYNGDETMLYRTIVIASSHHSYRVITSSIFARQGEERGDRERNPWLAKMRGPLAKPLASEDEGTVSETLG